MKLQRFCYSGDSRFSLTVILTGKGRYREKIREGWGNRSNLKRGLTNFQGLGGLPFLENIPASKISRRFEVFQKGNLSNIFLNCYSTFDGFSDGHKAFFCFHKHEPSALQLVIDASELVNLLQIVNSNFCFFSWRLDRQRTF